MVRADAQQTRVLPLGAGVGLRGNRREAGDAREVPVEAGNHLHVAGGLVDGREGVHVAHLGPGHGGHLHGGVELHGAATQRDHRPVQGQVLVLERLHVAKHLSLGVVGVEHRMGQDGRLSLQRGADAAHLRRLLDRTRRVGHTEGAQQRDSVSVRDGLTEGQTHGVVIDATQVHAVRDGRGLDLRRGLALAGDIHTHGVEERTIVLNLVAGLLEDLAGHHSHAVDATGDLLESLGAVVDRVEGSHVGQQGLGRADVGGGLVAADVLLARLHRHAQRGLATRIHTHTDDASGHLTRVGGGGREETSVRTAKTHGHTESLRRTHCNVKTHLADGLEQHRGHEIGAAHHERAVRMRLGGEIRPVLDASVGIGVLNHHTTEIVAGQVEVLVHRAYLYVHAEGVAASAGQRDVLGVAALVHEELGLLLVLQREAHRHGLSRGGGLVQQGGAGQGQASDVGDHGLVVEQGLQATLGDLRLVRGVRSVPSGVLEHVSEDNVRSEDLVVTHSDEGLEDLVLGPMYSALI
eukprot:Colp12_sorted_trinity150504_noHs@10374